MLKVKDWTNSLNFQMCVQSIHNFISKNRNLNENKFHNCNLYYINEL